jgi:hypothetical protein
MTMTALRGSTTASTRMVRLSWVMTSCGGTFMATVWRLTLTMRSMPNGTMKKSPGPLTSDRDHPAEPEYDAALILLDHPDA